MPLPLLASTRLFDFPANALPKLSFSAFGVDYAGVQFTAFEGDELAWDSDVYGRWRGPMPLHTTPAGLSISGATYTRDTGEFVPLATITDGTDPVLSWTLTNANEVQSIAAFRVLIQDCSDGTLIYNEAVTRSPVTLPSLGSGSYTVWVRIESALQGQALPDDYYEVTGYAYIPDKFRYKVTGVEYIWDWLHDVGIRPADTAQIALDGITVMYDEYNALVDAGALENRQFWTMYIRNAGDVSGEWAAIRLQVGGGAFAVGAGVLPAPGAALVKDDGTGLGSVPVAFDITARSITAAKVLSNGKVRIAGSFSTRDGVALGYWDLNQDGTATQLGAGEVDYFWICEASLLNHFASDIWEDKDGTQWILTIANLRKYDAYKLDVYERLTLANITGWPGGRCLRRDRTGLKFFTESFDTVAMRQAKNIFYNRLYIHGDNDGTGVGTVFHGDNCSELFMGRMYGWRQEGQFDNPNATQYIARLAYDTWDSAGMPSFAASAYNWQRLCAINADSGLRMLAAGIDADSHAARWAIVTQQQITEASSAYRVRRMQAVETGAYAVAFTGDNVWANIHFTGEFVKACFTFDDGTSTMTLATADATAAGIDVAKLPPYLLWNPLETAAGGGVWIQTTTQPESGTYLTLSNSGGLLQYSGTLPYNGDTWCRICFTVYDDGGTGTDAIEPDACCSDAACAAALFDAAEGCADSYESISVRGFVTGDNWNSIQVSDPNDFTARVMRKLDSIAVTVPNLWARVDSSAAADDLSSYTIRVPWNRRHVLPKAATSHVDIVALMPPCYEAVRAPVLERRD